MNKKCGAGVQVQKDNWEQISSKMSTPRNSSTLFPLWLDPSLSSPVAAPMSSVSLLVQSVLYYFNLKSQLGLRFLAISSDLFFLGCVGGRAVTWGKGTSGQLGHGEMANCLRPKVVQALEGFVITHVSAGWNHSGFVSGIYSTTYQSIITPSVGNSSRLM